MNTHTPATPCSNSDHDGAEVPAVARITDPWGSTSLCTYCAESYMTHLVRLGESFAVTPMTETRLQPATDPAHHAERYESEHEL